MRSFNMRRCQTSSNQGIIVCLTKSIKDDTARIVDFDVIG